MSTKLNLVLIFGGKSGEHAVSLLSASSVLNALDHEKYNIFQVGITREGRWTFAKNTLEAFEHGQAESLNEAFILARNEVPYLYELIDEKLHQVTQVDIVFPILHGTFGEDGTIQGLFEIQNCAYVGAGVLASSVAMDKALAKDVVSKAGIPVLPYRIFSRRQIENDVLNVMEEVEAISAYPVFVKPANLGSSVGISKVKDHSQLLDALKLAARYDRRVLVERGVDAREIEISVLSNEEIIVSQPGEIVPGDEFYTYKDKYHSGDPETAIPAPLPEQVSEQLRTWAVQTFRAIDGAGLARVDFLLDKNTGKAWFNEINTMPGFTQISMYSKLLLHSGIEYKQLIDRLIELGLERKAEQVRTIRKFEVDNE
ncbi:MAG: D-alanine--D-alanine ligase family protein [Anaerolineaceae bacterium]